MGLLSVARQMHRLLGVTGRQLGCLVMGLTGSRALELLGLGFMVLLVHKALESLGLGVTGPWGSQGL